MYVWNCWIIDMKKRLFDLSFIILGVIYNDIYDFNIIVNYYDGKL